MARIRTIKPEFWTDGDIMDLSPFARLLFIGSWNFAMCDFGHVADDPRRLKMQVLPGDDVDAAVLVDEIVDKGRMRRIEVDGRSFLHITRFTDHQKTEKRWTPRCPACKGNRPEPLPTSPNLSETPATSAQERKGREGRGGEPLVTSVSHLQSVEAREIDDDGLDQIRGLTGGDRAHARKIARTVLGSATEDVRHPLAYVLRSVRNSPGEHRAPKRGNPKKHEECPTHAGQWADACAGCAADRKASA